MPGRREQENHTLPRLAEPKGGHFSLSLLLQGRASGLQHLQGPSRRAGCGAGHVRRARSIPTLRVHLPARPRANLLPSSSSTSDSQGRTPGPAPSGARPALPGHAPPALAPPSLGTPPTRFEATRVEVEPCCRCAVPPLASDDISHGRLSCLSLSGPKCPGFQHPPRRYRYEQDPLPRLGPSDLGLSTHARGSF